MLVLWFCAHEIYSLHWWVAAPREGRPPERSFEDLQHALLRPRLAGVILALFISGKELALQRRELEETREELKRSASAQEASHQALIAAARVSTLQFLINAAGGEFLRASLDKMLGTEPESTTLRDGLQEDCLAELMRELDRLKRSSRRRRSPHR